MKYFKSILLLLLIPVVGFSQGPIYEVEYFINTDPGFGNGTQASFSPNTELDLNLNINLSGIPAGLNTLYFRAKNDSGWTQTYSKPFLVETNSSGSLVNVAEVEYYIDSDPGYGQGQPFSITTGGTIDVVSSINLAGISPGMHMLHLRAKDANGVWGHNSTRPFLVVSAAAPQLSNLEYFIDNDPGFGNGTLVPLNSSSADSAGFSIDLLGISNGLHMLYVRAMDQNNVPGQTYIKPFLVGSSTTQNDIVALEYFYDTDPGYGLGNNLPISNATITSLDSVFALASLSDGLHILHIRAKDENGKWSLNYTKPVLKTGTFNAQISQLEFHVDSFVGYGNGTSIPLNQASVIDTSLILNLNPQIEVGNHKVYIAARDNNMAWSLVATKSFCVGAVAQFTTDTVCFGETTRFTDSSIDTDSTTTYWWDITGNGVKDSSIATSFDYAYDTSGTFLATLILNKDSMCSDTFTTEVIVKPNYITASFSSDSVCFGNQSTITNTTIGGSDSTNWVWDIQNDGNIDFTDSIGFQTILGSGYTVIELTAFDDPLCTSKYVDSVFVDSTDVNAAFTVDTTCALTSTTITDISTGNTANASYAWDVFADGTIDSTDVGNINYTFTNDSVYAIQLILNPQSLCPDTFTSQVVVLPNFIQASFTSDTVCFSNFTSVINTSTDGSDSTHWEWDINNNGTIDFTDSVGFNHQFNAGLNPVKLTAYDAELCPSIFVDTVFVDSTDVNAQFISDTACFNRITTIQDVSTGNISNASYSWDILADGSIDYTTQGDVFHAFGQVGSYPVQLILNAQELCPDTFNSTILVDSLGTIVGTISNGQGPITDGYAKLYSIETAPYTLIDSVPVNALGNYEFIDLTPGNYVLRGNPNTITYPNTVATYYDSTYLWSNATVINSLCDTTIDFNLLDISQVVGDGSISGFVFLADTIGQRAGDPIPGIGISLEQRPGGIIGGYTETDSSGHYEFNNLPDFTYEIKVDIPGAPMDTTYTVTINSSDTLFQNLDFVFDSVSIDIRPVVISSLSSSKDANLHVYPNPFNSTINIANYSAQKLTSVKVYNIIGELVYTTIEMDSKTTQLQLPQTIGSGTYFLHVSAGNKTAVFKLVKL